jgi:phospholipid/cholesterol/gamma-HCH transport system substrate-binding protein
MKNTLETRLGIFFALAFLAAVFIIEMIGGADLFKGGYRLKAQFSNVQDLRVGDAVKMGGVQIGRVESMDFADTKVTVVMKITNRKAGVRTDSKATVKFAGLMGQNYVGISFGSPGAPKMESDGEVATIEQADLSALMVKLESAAGGMETMTKNFSSENFSSLLGPLTDFLKENKDRLSATISNVQVVSAQIAQGKGTVGKLINEDTLYQSALLTVTNFSDTATEVRAAVGQARTVIAGVSEGQGTLGRLVKDEALYNEGTNAMTNLREILQKVNRGQGSVGKLVNDEALFNNARLTLQKLDKASDGLEDQGPLSILGVMANSLF